MGTFGENLKTLRGSLSQAVFANSVGLKQQRYANYESGLREPDLTTLREICLSTGVSADWLLGIGDGHPPQSTADTPRPTAGMNCETCKYKRLAEALKAVQAD